MLVGQRLSMLASSEHPADLLELSGLFEDGRVTPPIERTYPLRRTPDAMRHLVAGTVSGKLVITVAPRPT